MDITLKVSNIKTKTDFVKFVELLAEDFKNNSVDWENRTLPEFLEALAIWTEDMEGYYTNINIPVPTNINWQVMANMLMAATMYE